MSLLEMAGKGTELTYSSVGAALAERAEAHRAVERMLDALEQFPRRSAPVMAFPPTAFPALVSAAESRTRRLMPKRASTSRAPASVDVGIGCRHRDRP